MIQMYRPGTSIVHRMPAGAKLAIFAALAIGVSAYPHDAGSIGVTVIGVCALFSLARLPLRVLAAEAWRLRWLGGALWLFVSPLAAWISTARVLSLVLLASLLTITTRMGDLLGVLHRMLLPLRRLGVDADAVSMAISLTITMIPVVASFAHEIRDAQRT